MKPIRYILNHRLLLFFLRLLGLSLLCSFLIYFSAGATEYHVAKNGNDANSGSLSQPFFTISRAAGTARPGDTITVHAGIYRELISPKNGGLSETQRITYQAARDEKVEIKGSEIIRGWIKKGPLWEVTIANTFFKNYNPYTDLVFGDWFFPGRNKVHTGEVYLEGKPLSEMAKADAPYSWSTSAKADSITILANFGDADPNILTAEINVRPACFYPAQTGINFVTIRGFHFSQAATQWAAPTAEQIGLIGTNWSKGWIIENNTISDSKCVGIALGKDRASGHNVWFENMKIDGAVHYNNVVQKVLAEGWSKATIGSHNVRNNTIYRCGQAGVVGSFGAAFSQITGNHIYDIYTYRNFWGAEMAGIKLHAGIDALISGNRIHNTQKGIWLDWMTQGTRVSRNLLYDNDFVDIFLEVNHGPYLVDNNLLLSGYNLKDLSEGGAFVHNLFAGLISRAPDARTTPYFKSNGTRYIGLKDVQGGDDRFYNNIFIGRKGKSYSSETYPAKLPDEIDAQAGYGLAIYDEAKLPVNASGNLYLNGAYPMRGEKQAQVEFNQDFDFKIETRGELVNLKLFSGAKTQGKILSIVTSAILSKNVNGHGYTSPDGSALKIDLDYFGYPRTTGQNFAGPFALNRATDYNIWPVPLPKK